MKRPYKLTRKFPFITQGNLRQGCLMYHKDNVSLIHSTFTVRVLRLTHYCGSSKNFVTLLPLDTSISASSQ
jgi:hypothetical protein